MGQYFSLVLNGVTIVFIVVQNLEIRLPQQSVTFFIQRECCLELGGSAYNTKRQYKGGGTVPIIIGSVTGRMQTTESDWLGRWTLTRLQGRDDKGLTVVTAY